MGKIYNIPLDKNFLSEVAIFIKNFQNSKVNIAQYTVFLPNRRSCRELKYLILKGHSNNIAMLPKIKSISDEFLFDDTKITLFVVNLLKKNIKNKNISINTFFELAKSVECLIKDLIFNDVDLKELKNIVPQHFLEYWNHTIYTLYECIECYEIKKAIQTIKNHFFLFINSIEKNHEKIIAAGIGDTNKYTIKFLESVSASENGIIFFTGNEKKHSQNQCVNQKIINRLEKDFENIDYSNSDNRHVTFSQFSSLSEEALAIAITVRKAVFEKKSVLIVASDTALSTKIKLELLRWNIVADDSFGKKFSETSDGIIISSVIDAVYSDFRTSDILNILKFNQNYSNFILEMELFFRTQPRVPPDFFDAFNLWRKNEKNIGLFDKNSDCIQKFIKKIQDMYDLTKEFRNDIRNSYSKEFINWFHFCIELVKLINNESAEQFKSITSRFIRYSYLLGKITFEEFVVFLKNQIISVSVRLSKGYTEGVVILGVIEAQLLTADIVIIAGANESSISSSKKDDFWMSKSMLSGLGIQTAEARNEFIRCIIERLIHKPQVLITRSKMISGVQQQVYSYLEKVIKENDRNTQNLCCIFDSDRFIRHLYKRFEYAPFRFISPNPGLRHRPNKISATNVELLASNPYAFYAKKILFLKKIHNINDAKNIRGIFVHEVLNRFTKENNADFTVNKLNYIAENVLKNMWLDINDFEIWFFRLKNIFAFFIENMNKDVVSFSEKIGECVLDISSNYTFNIFCIADRIDVLKDNTLSIIDYKTGVIPSIKQVECGYKPQLPIEAIIAKNNGFKIGKTSVSSLSFWSLNGIGKGGKIHYVVDGLENTECLIEKTLNGLRKLINHYNVIGIPYNINLNSEYDQEYAHLARVKEWRDA